MNPSEIKAVMAEIGGGANKRLGQHFLVDRGALEAIVKTADIQNGDHVLEIGPGLGVLTRAMLEKGAEISAIEQDRRFVAYLQDTGPVTAHIFRGSLDGLRDKMFAAPPVGTLKVVHGDAVKMDWAPLVASGSWKFVSNLPYSITSFALRKALWCEQPPSLVVVLVQREVAERAISREKTSLLSLMVALASREAKIVQRVPASAFFPPPKVESAILQILPLLPRERVTRWGIDPEQIMVLAKRGFAHPRKLLASNLGLSEEQRIVFTDVSLNPKARAEDLSPEQWAALTRALLARKT